jgi:1,4-alpha-glucan branching enzyme
MTFIKEVIKKLKTHTAVNMVTAGEYIEKQPPSQAIELPESSWGAGGHYQVWYNNDTEWMWPIIHSAEKSLEQQTKLHKDESPQMERALKQAARELLLLESSDWPFLITTGQAKQYAVQRFNEHHQRFQELLEMISSSSVNETRVAEIEEIDNCFAEIDSGCLLFEDRETQVAK